VGLAHRVKCKRINADEAAFLSTVDWHLYVSPAVFSHWATKMAIHVRPWLAFSDVDIFEWLEIDAATDALR